MNAHTRGALIVGSSDGIGLATAQRLLGEGWSVAGLSRSPGSIVHERYRHTLCDVRSAAYGDVLSDIVRLAPTLDCVVYCVGVGNDDPPERGRNEASTVDTNFTAAVRTLEVVLPYWVPRRSGHFIGLTSLADAFHLPDAASYCGSKLGLSRYLECVGLQVRSLGIAVTNLRFGFVDTKMARSNVKPLMITAERAAAVIRDVIDDRPLRRSYPRHAALAAAALGLWSRIRVATSRPPEG